MRVPEISSSATRVDVELGRVIVDALGDVEPDANSGVDQQLKPAKSTTMKASMDMLESFSTVDRTHAIPGPMSSGSSPPSAPQTIALLNMSSVVARWWCYQVLTRRDVQRVSWGMETICTRERSALT